MKTIISISQVCGFLLLIVTCSGCATSGSSVAADRKMIVTPESDRTSHDGAVAVSGADGLAEIIRSKVLVLVKDVSGAKGEITAEIASKVEAELIEKGFLVKGGEPFVTVDLKSAIDLFDKTGNYFVFEGVAEATITKADGQKLGSKEFVSKGQRQLEQERAERNVADAISEEVAKWVGETCTAKTMGVETVIVSLRISDWATLLRSTESAAEKEILKFSEAVEKLDGVLSCRLVKSTESNRLLQFRIVYDSEKFPNGILTGTVTAKALPGELKESNPMLWLIRSIFRLGGDAF